MTPSRSATGPVSLDAVASTWAAAVEGLAGYWADAVERRASPTMLVDDARRWWTTASARRPPAWALPNEIVFENEIARLRDFSDGAPSELVPTLVLPPQAGHDSCIVDYSATQSQIGTIRAAGLTRTFALDWKGATAETRDASIEDYVGVLDEAVKQLGGRVNLVGDCQGGWLATLFTALRPDAVHSLTIAGAPIDFHAGDAAIHRWVQACTPGGSMSFYRALVAAGGGVLKGEHMLNGFIVMAPQSEVARQLQLLAGLRDDEHVERYREFEDWFKHTQDIPGAFYLWIVERLFRDNALIAGELRVGGELVDLRRVECPLFLLAGDRDHITPPAQVFALADHVSTAPARIHRRTARGGHLGLFMGRDALQEHWSPLMRQVAALS